MGQSYLINPSTDGKQPNTTQKVKRTGLRGKKYYLLKLENEMTVNELQKVKCVGGNYSK